MPISFNSTLFYQCSDHRERDYERTDSWRTVAPNSTIMVSNLPLHVAENEVSFGLLRSAKVLFLKSVCLIDSGEHLNARTGS